MTFGVDYLSPVIAEFLRAYDGIDADVHFSDRTVDVVDEGFDIVVRISREKKRSLITRKLLDVEGYVCANSDYLEAHGRPDHPKDLSDHDCLQYTYLSAGNRWLFQKGETETAVPVSGSLKANNGEALMEAAKHGVGIILTPDFIVGEALEQGELERLMPDWTVKSGSVWAAYPQRRHLATKVRLFVNFLQENLAANSYDVVGT
jgi:DNA-binding transcriptional LysR family regulator